MKSESDGSHKPSIEERDSAGIYEFLYVDRVRVSTLYAQLFPQGILTSVKTTAQQGSSSERDFGTDVGVFKAQGRMLDTGYEGIEHMFDASWSIPLDVLSRLEELGKIGSSIHEAGLGQIILSSCHMRVIDYSDMEKLWEPAMKMALADGATGTDPSVVPIVAEALRSMPRAIHAQFVSQEAFLWSSLQPTNLTLPSADLTLKYGGSIPGEWKVVYILDSWGDDAAGPDFTHWSAGPLIDGLLTAMHGLRQMMGRPANWLGITPLMIYRSIDGWRPKPSQTLTQEHDGNGGSPAN